MAAPPTIRSGIGQVSVRGRSNNLMISQELNHGESANIPLVMSIIKVHLGSATSRNRRFLALSRTFIPL
jgi:hypothetical protein